MAHSRASRSSHSLPILLTATYGTPRRSMVTNLSNTEPDYSRRFPVQVPHLGLVDSAMADEIWHAELHDVNQLAPAQEQGIRLNRDGATEFDR
ncbi:hypothetical protein L227DRAFT_259281 [Lentinus tigrinus ALCF2SS1-6]|uniref:Uncharacterized protein n=1 Tax=Lentinus tigrinus ALCF2SS1-6 TaxID=1328759 RepID=A0A5C2RZE1_9APHY|nr:hypothetical protein L227DRAFT_259281 [Lentinus tigrinus ALCF2SS1-6]